MKIVQNQRWVMIESYQNIIQFGYGKENGHWWTYEVLHNSYDQCLHQWNFSLISPTYMHASCVTAIQNSPLHFKYQHPTTLQYLNVMLSPKDSSVVNAPTILSYRTKQKKQKDELDSHLCLMTQLPLGSIQQPGLSELMDYAIPMTSWPLAPPPWDSDFCAKDTDYLTSDATEGSKWCQVLISWWRDPMEILPFFPFYWIKEFTINNQSYKILSRCWSAHSTSGVTSVCCISVSEFHPAKTQDWSTSGRQWRVLILDRKFIHLIPCYWRVKHSKRWDE